MKGMKLSATPRFSSCRAASQFHARGQSTLYYAVRIERFIGEGTVTMSNIVERRSADAESASIALSLEAKRTSGVASGKLQQTSASRANGPAHECNFIFISAFAHLEERSSTR
jgi:hypothetical protein